MANAVKVKTQKNIIDRTKIDRRSKLPEVSTPIGDRAERRSNISDRRNELKIKPKSKMAQAEMSDKPRPTMAEELSSDPKIRTELEKGFEEASKKVKERRFEPDRRTGQRIFGGPDDDLGRSQERRKLDRRQSIDEIKRLKGELQKAKTPGGRDTLERNVPKIQERIKTEQAKLTGGAKLSIKPSNIGRALGRMGTKASAIGTILQFGDFYNTMETAKKKRERAKQGFLPGGST